MAVEFTTHFVVLPETWLLKKPGILGSSLYWSTHETFLAQKFPIVGWCKRTTIEGWKINHPWHIWPGLVTNVTSEFRLVIPRQQCHMLVIVLQLREFSPSQSCNKVLQEFTKPTFGNLLAWSFHHVEGLAASSSSTTLWNVNNSNISKSLISLLSKCWSIKESICNFQVGLRFRVYLAPWTRLMWIIESWTRGCGCIPQQFAWMNPCLVSSCK